MALSSTAASGMPVGHEEEYSQQQLSRPARGGGSGGGGGPGGYSSAAAVSQLFSRLSQEIEEKQPPNVIHFVVDFLCKHYPEHLHGFASIWQMDPDLERERHEVVNFFRAHKISTAVAAHFTNAGYDTLDTLTTLTPDSLIDVEAFNNVKWLPGHKVRLQQIFGEISARVRAYRQELEKSQQSPRQAARHHSGHNHHGGSHHGAASSSPAHHVAHRSPIIASGAHPATAHPAAAHPVSSYLSSAHPALPASSYPAASAALHHPALAGHGAPSVLTAGIGAGVHPPALMAPGGNLFANYSPYPHA